MAGLNAYDCEGTLTIGAVSMNRAAWAVLGDETGQGGMMQLATGGEQRGSDRLLPSSTGVIAYPRRLTVTTADLRLLIVGDVDETGALNADKKIGLVDNIDYIYDNVVTPTGTGDGTRAATLDLPGQVQRSANIHVIGMVQQQYLLGDNPIWVGTLRISIPGGRFT